MIGHGAMFPAGDRDLATTEDKLGRIRLLGFFRRYFRAPAFLNDIRMTRPIAGWPMGSMNLDGI